jgi:hypothetical protein
MGASIAKEFYMLLEMNVLFHVFTHDNHIDQHVIVKLLFNANDVCCR